MLMESPYKTWCSIFLSVVLLACSSPPTPEIREVQSALMPPIELFRNQGSTSVTSWPATFGVPLARGVLRPSTHLGVVNDLGQSIPAQIEHVADWEDGSIRWIRVSFEQSYSPGRRYYLTELAAAPPPRWDDIQIVDNGTELLINTTAARFRFAGGAFPQQIHFDLNRNNAYESQELFSDNAGGAFYAVRTDGRRGTLTPTSISRVAPDRAVTPTRYAVVRVAGDYLDNQNGQLLAKAVIYYHFYAGKERFRLDHKFIITTHGSAFAEIGIDVPVAVQTSNAAVLDTNGAPYQSVLSAGNTLQMVQREFPRFNNNDSKCSLLQNGAVVQLGDVCGSWADLSGPQTPGGVNWGMAVQVPGFAEQFPKAFELRPQRLKVELWSTKEGAMAWSFSTLDLFTNYFGSWMDAAPQSWRNLVSANGGVGKTHEVWFYPHEGNLAGFNPTLSLGATTEPPITYPDLTRVVDSGVFGALGHRIPGQFDAAEAVMTDYFDRNIFVSRRVFPPNGSLLYGMHPYVGQGWVLAPWWHPVVSALPRESRLSRSFDYNLRRALFPLWIRTGDRRFFDYARAHARFSHDLQFSNTNAGIKPKGWIVVGAEDPPMLWGAFGSTTNLNVKPTARFSNSSALVLGGADDLAQLVHAYFLTTDFHAREMVESWISAVDTEIKLQTNPLTIPEILAIEHPEAMLRMLGSAYELNHEPWVKNFGDSLVTALRPPNPSFEYFVTRTGFDKSADVFSSYYYYYLATGSQTAKKIVLDRADFGVRYSWRDRPFTRHTADLILGSALAATDRGDILHGAHVRRVLELYGRQRRRLADLGMTWDQFQQDSPEDWQQRILTTQVGRSFGLPAVMQGIRTNPAAYPPSIPIQMPEPTDPVAIVFEHGTSTTLDLVLNMDASDSPNVRLLNLATNQTYPVAPPTEPPRRLSFEETASDALPWYLNTGSVASLTVALNATHPSGQYRLTLGEHVRWKILRHTASRLVLEAPRGLPMVGFEDYFFQAQQTGELWLYAFRPVEVQTLGGTPVPLDRRPPTESHYSDGSHRDGLYKIFALAGTTYRVRSVPTVVGDVDVDTPQDNFIRLNNQPGAPTTARPVFAVGTEAHLFMPSQVYTLPYPDYDANLATTTVGQHGHVTPGQGGSAGAHQFYEVLARTPNVTIRDPNGGPDLERGTVSFWMKPHWEPSHRAAANGLTTTLFKLGEMELTYTANADAPGNGSLRRGFFLLNVPLGFAQDGNNGDEQNPGGAIAVHFRHWLIGGRWYHVAMTWDLDGDPDNGDSKIELFIDGHPKVRYARMNARALGRDARLSGTALDPKPIEFGSREDASEHMAYGTTLDDVRVYRNELCYAAPLQRADPCVTPFFHATFDDPSAPLRATLNDGSGQIDLAVVQTLP